jgi:tripartite-type tricarboxylate transporter receptor subunit TctC
MARLLVLGLATLLLTLVSRDFASAQSVALSWPTHDVHVLVPQSAGSALDIVTRSVMEQVAPRLGQPIIVENRTGAGNTIAMAAVARAEPDGYTVLANSATHSLVPVTYTTLPFDTFRDLAPVIPLGNTPLVMVVSASRSYKGIADFVADAKAKRGAMNYATGGVGSLTHLASEAFRLAAGFDAVHVPFKGAPEALTEVLGGRVDFYFAPLPAALPFLKDGTLRALAVSASNRALALPDVPTIKEAGYPDATYNFWVGLFLPAKTPAPVMDRLYRETQAALQTAIVRDRLDRLGADPLALDRAGFAKLIADEFALNTKVAKAAGVKAN